MKNNEELVLVAIVITMAASFLYMAVLNWVNHMKVASGQFRLLERYLIRKLSGFLILGLIPAFTGMSITGTANKQLFKLHPAHGYFWVVMIFFSGLLILLNLMNSKDEKIQTMYPELRLKEWTFGSLLLSGLGWIIYLTGYEYLFRGMLLFICVKALGIPLAVGLNLALYSSLHLHKSLKEALAALPFGGLLCYITLQSGSVWPAVIIHVIQAISVETACIFRNQDMKFILFKKPFK